jgi:protease-4
MRTLAVVALCVAAGACGGARERANAKQQQPEPAPAAPGTTPPPAPAPSPAMAAAGLMGALGQAGQPGPWDEPKQSKGARASEPHLAVVEVGGSVNELEDMSWFSMGGGVQLRELAVRLHGLARDEQVTGIVLRVGDLSMSMAQAEELRATVAAVRARKPVHCHTEGAANATYLVLTACASIGLAPTGGIVIPGPTIAPLYLRGLLAKLGLEADFIHIGAFKGAAEPLTRDGPSAEMRATYDAILDGEYESLVAAVAEGRTLDPARAKALVDTGMFTDVQAKAAGLVDEVATFEAWRDEVSEGKPWIKVPVGKEPAKDMQGLMELLGLQPKPRITEPHVALVYAVGDVVDGKGEGGALSAFQEIASRRLSAALRAAAEDDSVKAVVLRVDSPGGSALASEIIWHAVQEVKAKKPVVVSMGSLAASGGYYISCGADTIWAQPNTLTGSIGVVGGKIVLGQALGKLGVSVVEMSRGKRATLYSTVKKWTAEERQLVEAEMRYVYDVFKKRVADGRKKTVEEIEPIAQGRVWVGRQAKEKGLVDQLGGLDDALADAKKRAGLPEDAPVDVYPGEPTLMDLLEGLGGEVRAGLGPSLVAELRLFLGDEGARTALATLRLALGFREHAVRVVVLLPIVR